MVRAGLAGALLCTVPIAADPWAYGVDNVTKYTVLVVGAIALVAVSALELIWRGRLPRWRNGLHWPVVALITWSAIVAVASSDVRGNMLGAYRHFDGLWTALALVVVMFAVADTFSAGGLRAALTAMYAAGTVAVLGGVSLFGNPNHVAAFAASILPVGVVLLVLYSNRWARASIAASIVVLMLDVLLAGSEGALLGAVAALAFVAGMSVPWSSRRPLVVLAPATALLVLVVPLLLAFDAWGSASVSSGGTTEWRAAVWQTSLEMAADRPLLGFGLDQFSVSFPEYRPADFVERFGTMGVDAPHNVFLNYLTGLGVIGLLLFAALLVLAARLFVTAYRRLGRTAVASARTRRAALICAAGGCVAYLVQGAFDNQQIALSFTFWTLLGFVCAAAWDDAPERTKAPERTSTWRIPTLAAAPLATLTVAGALTLGWLAASPYRTDRAFRAALESSDPAELRRSVTEAIRRNESADDYLSAAGAAAFARAELGTADRTPLLRFAREMYARAVETQPLDAGLWGQYGDVLAALGALGDDRAEQLAVRAFRTAVEIDPSEPDFAIPLANALAAHGDTRQARAVLQRALSRSPDDVSIRRAWRRLLRQARASRINDEGDGEAARAALR